MGPKTLWKIACTLRLDTSFDFRPAINLGSDLGIGQHIRTTAPVFRPDPHSRLPLYAARTSSSQPRSPRTRTCSTTCRRLGRKVVSSVRPLTIHRIGRTLPVTLGSPRNMRTRVRKDMCVCSSSIAADASSRLSRSRHVRVLQFCKPTFPAIIGSDFFSQRWCFGPNV